MKIVFKKNEESQISVFQKADGREQNFVYVDMIKTLVASREMEDPEIIGKFTEAEIKSINSMVALINNAVSTTEKSIPKE